MNNTLRAGEASVGDISRGCAFSRARIYGILDNLVARAAAHQVSVHPRTYAPENPRRLAEMRLRVQLKEKILVNIFTP